jgi:uncharacterized membrane protein YhaH (DUF805 family)
MTAQYAYPAQPASFRERLPEYFSFEGRIGRQSYWLRSLALGGINIVAAILFAVAGEGGAVAIVSVLLGIAIYAASTFAGLATVVKRLHDRGRSGWFMLISLIPFVGIWLLIEVGFLAGSNTPNEYGDPV